MAVGTDTLWNSTSYWSEPAEQAFARALVRGRIEMWLGRLRGRESAPTLFRTIAEPRGLVPDPVETTESVPLRRIVGSVGGRGYFFTRSFRPKSDAIKPRWKRAFAVAHGLRGYEPIELYEADGEYYVVDGHFRTSVGRTLGFDTIEARVRHWH